MLGAYPGIASLHSCKGLSDKHICATSRSYCTKNSVSSLCPQTGRQPRAYLISQSPHTRFLVLYTIHSFENDVSPKVEY